MSEPQRAAFPSPVCITDMEKLQKARRIQGSLIAVARPQTGAQSEAHRLGKTGLIYNLDNSEERLNFVYRVVEQKG